MGSEMCIRDRWWAGGPRQTPQSQHLPIPGRGTHCGVAVSGRNPYPRLTQPGHHVLRHTASRCQEGPAWSTVGQEGGSWELG